MKKQIFSTVCAAVVALSTLSFSPATTVVADSGANGSPESRVVERLSERLGYSVRNELTEYAHEVRTVENDLLDQGTDVREINARDVLTCTSSNFMGDAAIMQNMGRFYASFGEYRLAYTPAYLNNVSGYTGATFTIYGDVVKVEVDFNADDTVTTLVDYDGYNRSSVIAGSELIEYNADTPLIEVPLSWSSAAGTTIATSADLGMMVLLSDYVADAATIIHEEIGDGEPELGDPVRLSRLVTAEDMEEAHDLVADSIVGIDLSTTAAKIERLLDENDGDIRKLTAYNVMDLSNAHWTSGDGGMEIDANGVHFSISGQLYSSLGMLSENKITITSDLCDYVYVITGSSAGYEIYIQTREPGSSFCTRVESRRGFDDPYYVIPLQAECSYNLAIDEIALIEALLEL